MNARFFLVAGACGAAALVIAGLGAAVDPGGAPETSAQAPVVTSRGHFETRLQPVLDGIGSTRDLPPVRLGGGAAPLSSACGRDASAAHCHGHAGTRP